VFVEDLPPSASAHLGVRLPAGLANLGNTCYANSTLEALRAVPELRSSLLTYRAAGGGARGGGGGGAPPSQQQQQQPAPKLTPALRAAMAACRVAPPMTRSELMLSSSLCATCANKRGAGTLVFCDALGCGKAYHLGCHKPPLAKVPSGRWTCMLHPSSKQ
jgi:hypothetical protein